MSRFIKYFLIVILLFIPSLLLGSVKYVILKDIWNKTELMINGEGYKTFLDFPDNITEVYLFTEQEVDYKFVYNDYESYFTYQTKKLWKTNEGKINVLKKTYCGQVYKKEQLNKVIENCLR